MYKRWTNDEGVYLENNWGKIPTKQIAEDLDRTLASVQRKATRMGLKMTDEEFTRTTGRVRWTDDMFEYLKENYGNIPAEDIAETLGVSVDNVKRRASYMGITGEYREWTQEDEYFLEDYWGSKSVEYLSEKLDRSENAIKLKAHKMGLGNQLEASGNWLSVPTVAKILGTSKSGVYYWVKNGIMKSRKLKVGDSFRYQIRYSYLIDFLKEHQDRYDTRKCDMRIIRGMLSGHVIHRNQRFRVYDIPDWMKQKIERDRQKDYVREPRDWTTGEERLLLRLVDEQNTLREIGAILNRSTESIRGKLRTIKSRDSISGSG